MVLIFVVASGAFRVYILSFCCVLCFFVFGFSGALLVLAICFGGFVLVCGVGFLVFCWVLRVCVCD